MADNDFPIKVDMDQSGDDVASLLPDNDSADSGYLAPEYALNFGAPLPEYSTDFATAYAVQAPQHADLYGICFERLFPLRQTAAAAMQRDRLASAVKLVSQGKVTNPSSGNEAFVIVLSKPKGVSMRQLIKTGGPLKEKDVMRGFLRQLLDAVLVYSKADIAHGTINPDTVFVDEANNKLCIDHCLASYCGYYQKPVYEDLNDLLTDIAAKGDRNTSSDCFALGMLLVYMLSGQEAFASKTRQDVLEWRLEYGSATLINRLLPPESGLIGRRTDALLKSLLCDDSTKRWDAGEIGAWLNMEEVMAPASKVHMETSTHFSFHGRDYHSTKRLAHHLHQNWDIAKRSLRMQDLARWLSITIKRPDLAEVIEALAPDDSSQRALLTDEKLGRIIVTLDPTGPIRLQGLATNIYGFGNLLVEIYREENQGRLQHFAAIIDTGMMNYWINKQEDTEQFGVTKLGWSHVRARRMIRKQGLGFGMERMMYELNPGLPCQSNLLLPHYALTVDDIFTALEKKDEQTFEESDPIDRHIAAFLSKQIGLNEEIIIRPMSRYPHIARNPYIIALGLFTVVKRKFNLGNMPNLSRWVYSKIDTLHDSMHSKTIKRDLKKELDKAVKEGAVDDMFGSLVSPLYIKKDIAGFDKAQKQYLRLEHEVKQLTGGISLRSAAFRAGLKVSAYISYTVLALTIFYVIFTA